MNDSEAYNCESCSGKCFRFVRKYNYIILFIADLPKQTTTRPPQKSHVNKREISSAMRTSSGTWAGSPTYKYPLRQ